MIEKVIPRKLIIECKKFLEEYTEWNEPKIFKLDGVNQLQAFQEGGYNVGIIQNNWDKKIWTFVHRKKIQKGVN